MDTSTLQTVIDYNKQHALFTPMARILVAVSGGADSTALLSILVCLKNKDQIKDLVCVHFNHELRDQANQDQRFVQSLAASWGIPVVTETQDVKMHAQTQRCSIETAGRQWRLERLTFLAQEYNCTAIATGHHQDDNAETLIHRLSRGTGYRGLCGIRPCRTHQNIRVISPLLALTRREILKYLKSQKQTWCEDATNRDKTYTRNHIRQALLPELSRQYPRLPEYLRALSITCHQMYTLTIEPRAIALLKSAVEVSPGYASVAIEALAHESTLVLVELIRQILVHLQCPMRTITQFHYRAVVDLLQGHGTHVNLPENLSVVAYKNQVQFRLPAHKPNPRLTPTDLVISGNTHFGVLSFETRIMTATQIDSGSRDNRTVECFDLKRLNLPLHIRKRQPGDHFIPLGKHTTQKVGKFLSRSDSTALDRIHCAILADAQGDVLWVCPVRMSDMAKITEETEDVLEISVRIDPET